MPLYLVLLLTNTFFLLVWYKEVTFILFYSLLRQLFFFFLKVCSCHGLALKYHLKTSSRNGSLNISSRKYCTDSISHGPLEPRASPIRLSVFYYYMTDISVKGKKKKKRFLSFKEKRKECPFCIRSSKWRRGFQAFLQLIIMGFLTCISEITFGHASYTVPLCAGSALLFSGAMFH